MLLCLWAMAVGGASAQERDPSSLYGRDSLQGVYVRDSAVAVEKFALAERMERLKEWGKAADVYQEIIEQYADRVLPSRLDEKNQIVQYTSAALAAQERLARWPADGLAAYCARFETAARTLLESGDDDPATLHRVCRLYFSTGTARRAALKLLDLQILSGEFASAAWLGDRLLTWHPTLDSDRPLILYRTALAYHLLGNAGAARARADELKRMFGQATAVIRGEATNLAEALESELLSPAATPANESGDCWPMSFGNASRDLVPETGGTIGARLFSVSVVRAAQRGTNSVARRDLEQMDRRSRADGYSTGILPAIADGELFFQDNARVYAVSLDSGLPLPGWAETYGGERGGSYALPGAWVTPRGTQLAICVTDDSVLAVMGQSDRMMQLYVPAAARDSRLVCLDRRTGRERWSVPARSLGQKPGENKPLEFTGTPIAVGNRVYVAAESGAGMQFEQCEVLCLDLATGRLLWRTYIASASTNLQPWDIDATAVNDSTPQISYSEGRLFVCTNLGATAALDGYDGTIVWLNLYPRDLSELSRLNQLRNFGRIDPESNLRGRPWSHNPVIVTGGRVFTLPRGAEHLLIYDAATGRELGRIPMRAFDKADTLVGVVGERAVIAGPRKITCLDWTRHAPDAPIDVYRLWSKDFQKGGADEVTIRGRAVVTADSVFVPLQWQVSRLSLKSGIALSSYPGNQQEWGDEEGPGNLIVARDHMVIAGDERVAVYTDLNLARAKLDREVAADPHSPLPRLRFAEVMFVAGRHEDAAAKLDEAMQLLGGPGALQPGPARDRLFNSSLSFARKLMDGKSPSSPAVKGFLDRAQIAASSPAQQVSQRLARARWARIARDDHAELSLYQEILADPTLRAEFVTQQDSPSTVSAGFYAQRAIAQLIARNPQAYEPVERQAQKEFDAIGSSGDPERLLNLAQTYPNSRVASLALQSAADAYETGGNFRQAATVLRLLLTRPLDTPARLTCLESLARNYLKLPNRLDVAAARLAQAARLAPEAVISRGIIMPDGKLLDGVTFAQAAEAVKRFRRDSARLALADVRLPEPPKPGAGRPPAAFIPQPALSVDANRLIVPMEGHSRFDRVVVYRNGVGVLALDVGTINPRFTAAVKDPPAGCAWVGQNLLLWTETRVVFLKGDDSGESMWEATVALIPQPEVVSADDDQAVVETEESAAEAADLRVRQRMIVGGQRVIIRAGRVMAQPAVRPGAAPVAGEERIIHVRPLSDRVIVATSQGRILAIDLTDGQVLWQSRPTDHAIERLAANDDFAVACFVDEQSTQLIAIDSGTGQTATRRVFNRDLRPVNFALSPDGKLLWLLPDALVAKDLFEPGDRLSFNRPQRNMEGMQPFGVEPRGERQLLVADDRILAVADNGQYIRVFWLEDGQPVPVESGEGRPALDLRLRTGSTDPNVQLFVAGSRVYAMGAYTLFSHDLERKTPQWSSIPATPELWISRDAVVTAGYLLVFKDPTGTARNRARQRNQSPPAMQIAAFSRAVTGSGGEAGRLEFLYEISEPSGIVAWQVVEGGVYYLTNDQKLHFLKGAGG